VDTKLNPNVKERRAGWLVFVLWLGTILFYCLWDGWIWEWHVHGYGGASQHLDLHLFDLQWERANAGSVTYSSTNNLHNIVYICFAVLTMAWIGLLFGSRWARQGVMATMGFPFVAALVTLTPSDHLYPVQIVHDLVHIPGIAVGLYFFYKDTPELEKCMVGAGITWGMYILSRLLCEPWPYWSENRNAYFSVNQINDMPFYFYGLEYFVVVLIIFGVHAAVIAARRKLPGPRARVLTPLILYGTMCGLFKALGLIEPPSLGADAFPF